MSTDRLRAPECLGSQIEIISLPYEQGPCGGVWRILKIADIALEEINGRESLYTNHDLVHNVPLMAEYKRRGLFVFENNWNLVPFQSQSFAIPSAHGVGPDFFTEANKRGCIVLEDSTCQLVKKVEYEAKAAVGRGYHILYLGSLLKDGRLHPEPDGIRKHLPEVSMDILIKPEDLEGYDFEEDQPLMVLTQTTLSRLETKDFVAMIRAKWPWVEVKDDICYATDNRQMAVSELLKPVNGVDLLLVVGSESSHNSQELMKIGLKGNIESYAFDDPSKLDPNWLIGKKHPMVTSGASAIRVYVDQLVSNIIEIAPAARVVHEDPVSNEDIETVFKYQEQEIREKIRAKYAA